MKNIAPWKGFLKGRFPLEAWKDTMRDERRRPQISAGTLAQMVVEMVPRGQTSLLEVDQAARLPEMRGWHESDRDMVASDSTLFRSLAGFALEPVRRALWESVRLIRKRDPMRLVLPSGRKARLGIVDGSVWGSHGGSVLALVGRRAAAVGGFAPSPGRGHELAVTRGVLREAVRELGRGFVDLMVADGLYMTHEDFHWGVEEGGYHLVVKTSEETLTVLQDARELFFGNPKEMSGSLEQVRGIDAGRGVEYEIVAAAGFSWGDLSHRLKVAHVRERAIKPRSDRPAETTFWCFTTDESLTAEDLREVAHRRWKIENNVFRRLSALVDSKRDLTNDAHVREALLGLWFLGFNLLAAFLSWTGWERRHPDYPTAKMTWSWLTRLVARETWKAGTVVGA